MFWSKKKAGSSKAPAGQKPPSGASSKPLTQGELLRQQALAQARAARENLGEDTIARIVAAMEKKKNSPIEQAKAQIQNADAERVAIEILAMLEKQ